MTEEEKKKAGEVTAQGQDTTPETKPTSRWRDVLGARNKELDLDDDDAVGGYLEGEFGRLDKSEEVNKRMNELISKDKRNAGLLSGMFSGKGDDGEDFDMVGYIVNNWFDELHSATTSEEAIERINQKMAEQEQEAAEDAKREQDAKAKFDAMEEALNAAMKKTNTDGATAQKLVDWLYGTEDSPGLYMRIAERNVTEDDFTKLIHAFTRDKSLEAARNEGIRTGKVQRAGAAHRSASEMAQTDLGGGGSSAEREQEEENPTATRYGNMRPRFT